MADYIIFSITKEEKKSKKILTENRLATINKRETSYEGLVSQLENGEDGIYNLTDEGNKGAIFKPKVSITKQDLEEIPFLKQVREAIQYWEDRLKTCEGKDAYVAKKAIIDLRKDQYLIKDAYRVPVQVKVSFHSKAAIPLIDSTHELSDKGFPIPEGVSLLDPKVVSAILCNYTLLKANSDGKFETDLWALMIDFDHLLDVALDPYPMYKKIVECKIAGLQNNEIQDVLLEEFQVSHTAEYISSLWRNKIPKLIASLAEDQWLDYYYLNVEKGLYKKCSRCGQIKLAHNKYFS